jgi:hypothetical protein
MELPFHDDEPGKCCSIGDPNRSPGLDCDSRRTEYKLALLINNDADESRGGSTRCLSGACLSMSAGRSKGQERERRECKQCTQHTQADSSSDTVRCHE